MNDCDFTFEINVPVRRVSDDDILRSLQDFVAQRKPGKPTGVAYDSWPGRVCTSATISDRFGGWRAALEKIGVREGVQPFEYSVEELLDNLERIWRELGYPPGKRRLAKLGARISERPYKRHWGSVKNACRLLAQYKNGEICQKKLLGSESPSRRGTISLKVRWDVLKRGNYMCARCGARPPDVSLEIDHIVPLARGGTDAISNLQVLCNRCNQGKKARTE
jgi:5-methylcytosine-specific restriction endonuclease McrA